MQAKALPHMEELLRLKDYSDEKDAQAQWVDQRVEDFKRMVDAVEDGTIRNFQDQASVIKAFGQPVLSESSNDGNGQTVTRWLYRHPIQKLAGDRVYVYWAADGRILKFEHIPAG